MKDTMRTTARQEDLAEIAMMGFVVSVESKEDASNITRYILDTLNIPESDRPRDINDEVSKYSKNTIKHLVCNVIHDMVCITYLLEGEDYPKPFEEDYGSGCPSAFCYVLNLDCPEFSEFGDCFFEKRGAYYHRVS